MTNRWKRFCQAALLAGLVGGVAALGVQAERNRRQALAVQIQMQALTAAASEPPALSVQLDAGGNPRYVSCSGSWCVTSTAPPDPQHVDHRPLHPAGAGGIPVIDAAALEKAVESVIAAQGKRSEGGHDR